MKKVIFVYLLVAGVVTSNLMAQSTESRISALEQQVNSIIAAEKERNEALNKLADSVLKLQRKLKPAAGISETEEEE